jgi:exopolysaccharide biosynthesis protein
VELADYMKGLGVEKAMNLDGGSSSSLYWDGKAFYGKGDGQEGRVRRSVKSVLLLK